MRQIQRFKRQEKRLRSDLSQSRKVIANLEAERNKILPEKNKTNHSRAKPSEMSLLYSRKNYREKSRHRNYERFHERNVRQENICLSPVKSSSPPFLCPRTPPPPHPSRVWNPPRAPSGSWRRRISVENHTPREVLKDPKIVQSIHPPFLANRENKSSHKVKHNSKQQKTTNVHPRGRRRYLNRPPSPGNQ